MARKGDIEDTFVRKRKMNYPLVLSSLMCIFATERRGIGLVITKG